MADYNNIFELVKYFQNTTPVHPFLKDDPNGYTWVDVRNSLPEELEWVNCGSDFPPGKLFPSIFSPYLYRGQSEIYTSCYPKVYRGFPLVKRPRELSVEYRTKFLVSQIKCFWFISLLQKHPAVHYAKKLNIQMNPVAIAQHYGMATYYLDLTKSIEVAAFFACCECKDKAWQPKISGKGVIYRFHTAASPEFLKHMELVGQATFPRPGVQKAWCIPLAFGADFEKVPHVEKLIFNQTPEGSARYLEKFDSGKVLFLEDPAAELASSVLNSKKVPKNFVIQVLLRFGCLPNKIEKTFIKFIHSLNKYCGIEVINKVPIDFTNDQIRKIRLYLSKHKDDFKGRVMTVRDSK
ncbi:MAG: FRG domain-containing protein [Candidatus Omnitrophica bacterium]|nr:FRG domain-containing protein [Candidatus Omnitrophota bacterium]